MANETTSRANGVPFGRSWLFLLAGLVLLGAAWLTRSFGPLELRIALLVVGFALTYSAVVERLRRLTWDFPDRLEAAAMVSVSILGAVACLKAMDDEWSSGRVFFAGLFALTLVGAVLLLLPPLLRRLALSLLVVFHLGGIVTAVTVVDPPNGSAPWVSQVLMARVYRPYLNLLYMSNAYHFYSPDPGTSSVLRFAVFYGKDDYEWVQVPDKKDCPIGMTYQRVNALPEHSFYSTGQFPPNDRDLQMSVPPEQRPPRGSWDDISRRRQNGALRAMRPNGNLPIPVVLDLDPIWQYQQPYRRVGTPDRVARPAHVVLSARAAPGGLRDHVSVKVYRVKINVLTPYELAKGPQTRRPDQDDAVLPRRIRRGGVTLLHPERSIPVLVPSRGAGLLSTFPARAVDCPVVNVRVDPPKHSGCCSTALRCTRPRPVPPNTRSASDAQPSHGSAAGRGRPLLARGRRAVVGPLLVRAGGPDAGLFHPTPQPGRWRSTSASGV